jgi:FlaA1/EpsC-like NDP-sugar epimerase
MENEYLTKHRQMLQVLKDSKAKLYIWGIGREFFILSTFTELLNCNVQSLLDKNQDKHGRTVSGIRIVAPEQIQQAAADATVLLTSVFNQIQMQEYLREISFSGSVIIIT